MELGLNTGSSPTQIGEIGLTWNHKVGIPALYRPMLPFLAGPHHLCQYLLPTLIVDGLPVTSHYPLFLELTKQIISNSDS